MASPVQRRGGFLSHPLVREGCFNFRGFGEKWYWVRGERKEIKWEAKEEDLQVQSKTTGTSVGYKKRLGRAEGQCHESHSFPSPLGLRWRWFPLPVRPARHSSQTSVW